MAEQTQQFVIVTPAGTPATSPLVSQLTLPEAQVDGIETEVPPGPAGLLYYQLTVSGAQVVPITAGTFFQQDDQHSFWPLSGYPTTGDWQLVSYNLGVYPHQVTVRFHLSFPEWAQQGPARRFTFRTTEPVLPPSAVLL